MNYLLKSKPKSLRSLKTVHIFILFVVLCVFGFLFPNITRSMFTTMSRPLWFISDSVSGFFTETKDFFTYKANLVEENTSLKVTVADLRLKQFDYEVLLNENQYLKGQNREKSGRVAGRILSAPPRSPYDTLVVGAGESDGVSVGEKVYISDSVIIGMVDSVTPSTSIVKLFSTDGQKLASINSRTGETFEMVGTGGTNFQIEVPKDTDIVWGDVFLYPAHSVSILATVYYIDINSQSAFKTVYAHSPGNVFATQWVFVEKN